MSSMEERERCYSFTLSQTPHEFKTRRKRLKTFGIILYVKVFWEQSSIQDKRFYALSAITIIDNNILRCFSTIISLCSMGDSKKFKGTFEIADYKSLGRPQARWSDDLRRRLVGAGCE
jgi:hypothetical protein